MRRSRTRSCAATSPSRAAGAGGGAAARTLMRRALTATRAAVKRCRPRRRTCEFPARCCWSRRRGCGLARGGGGLSRKIPGAHSKSCALRPLDDLREAEEFNEFWCFSLTFSRGKIMANTLFTNVASSTSGGSLRGRRCGAGNSISRIGRARQPAVAGYRDRRAAPR